MALLTDFRKVVNWVTVPAGREPGAITSKLFRHTYCSPRLATLDRGARVSAAIRGPVRRYGSRGYVRWTR